MEIRELSPDGIRSKIPEFKETGSTVVNLASTQWNHVTVKLPAYSSPGYRFEWQAQVAKQGNLVALDNLKVTTRQRCSPR